MNNKITNIKLRNYINLLDNMVLSCEKLTLIINANEMDEEQKNFIEIFMLTTKANKDFISNTVKNMDYESKYSNTLLKEFLSSQNYVDECLSDMNSIFFPEFMKITENFNEFA